jgi:signal peptidase I
MALPFDLSQQDDGKSKRRGPRISRSLIAAMTLALLLLPLEILYSSTQTYTGRVDIELARETLSPGGNDSAAIMPISTAEQILLSREMFDKISKQYKLSDLTEFDPVLAGRVPRWVASCYSTLWAAEAYLGAGPLVLTPYERVLTSYRERLKIIPDQASHRLLIRFSSANSALAGAVAQSIADNFLARSDLGNSAGVVNSVVGRTGFEMETLPSRAFALSLLAPLLPLFIKFGTDLGLWSLLWRLRTRTMAFSISVLALWALGMWLAGSEYRADAQILVSPIPNNYDGKSLSLSDEIRTQIEFLKSDQFALLYLTKIAKIQIANAETRTRVLRLWHQRLSLDSEDRVVSIAFQSPKPDASAATVGGIVDFIIRWRQELWKNGPTRDVTNSDDVISAALVSNVPVYPNRWIMLACSVVLTFGGAISIFLVRRTLAWFSQRRDRAATAAGIAVATSSFKPTRGEKLAVLLLVVAPFVFNVLVQHSIQMKSDTAAVLNLLVLLTWAVGYGVLYMHLQRRRRVQVNLNSQAGLLLENESEFVLYLRSFVSSKRLLVRNRLPGLLDRLLVGSFWDLEFALAYAYESARPLVAIGLAGGGIGASKLSVPDYRWKELFADAAQKARLIFIVPFATTGTLHEIMTLAGDISLLRKTVWIMPPSYFGFRWSVLFSLHRWRWEKVRKILALEGIKLPPYSRYGGLLVLDSRGSPIKRLSTDDFSESQMRPFAESIIEAAEHQEESEYTKRLDAIQFTKRNWRWYLSEWFFRRWLGDRLAGFSITSLLTGCLLALVIRTFLLQPFNIPSGSMKPTLLVGDYLLVSKSDYGYTHYSVPFSPELFRGRIFARQPKRGDVVVFRLPKDDTTDYIQRIVGLPGDRVRIREGLLYINDQAVKRERLSDFIGEDPCGSESISRVKRWKETLPDGVSYETLDCVDNGFYDNTVEYLVPPGHYFMLGDNRDNSTDSRVLSAVGYVPFENIIGRARLIYFSIRAGESAKLVSRWIVAVRWWRLFHFVE